jgi:phosphatidate cytidylyltransferase
MSDITPSEFSTRTMSAIILAAAVLFITFYDPLSFDMMVLIGAFILLKEWHQLTKHRGLNWASFGTLYIAAGAIALMYMRHVDLNILLSLFAIVWGGDIAGYLIGKKYGQHKIAPSISPGKSWEGLAGSIVVSAAIGASFGYVAPVPHAILGAVLAVVGLLGDMFESSLKRHAGVKDSGKLIPGHGGLFDRVDALLPCAIVAALALYLRMQGHG